MATEPEDNDGLLGTDRESDEEGCPDYEKDDDE